MALPNIKELAMLASGKTENTNGTDSPKDKSSINSRNSFFDNLIKRDAAMSNVNVAKNATQAYIERQDKNLEQKLLLRRIASNTDTIIDLLRDFNGSKDKNNGLGNLLKYLLPGLAGLAAAVAAINPEKTKVAQTAAKAGAKVVPKVLSTGAQFAKEAADAARAAGKGAGIVGSASAAAKILGGISTGAAKIGDSKLFNNAIRITSGGMMAGRALNGDYTGAGMEAASLGLHEASRVAKSPKAKIALTAASLLTDATLMGRDWLKGKDAVNRAAFEKENNITSVEDASIVTKMAGLVGVETEQSKRIEEQKASITPEQQKQLDQFDSNASDKNTTIGVVAAVVVTATLAFLGLKSGILSGGLKALSSNTGTIAKAGVAATSAAAAGTAAASSIGGKTIAKAGGKFAARLLPGAGLALGAYGAVSRAKDGDYLGATGEAVSGLASLIPVAGTAIAAVIQGGLMYRDYVKATSNDAGEINKIAKESTENLGNSAKENTKSVDAANQVIKKNSNEMTETVKKTDSLLMKFTTSLGTNLLGWITGGAAVFAGAFAVLNGINEKLWDWIKNSSLGQAVSSGVDAVGAAIDTTNGQAALGKHGGTMTGSLFAGESGGNYGIYNKHVGDGKYKSGQVDNNNTSLNTVTKMQDSGQMNAFGAYQIIGKTMKGAKKHLGLTGNEKMTQGLQDKIYQEYLIKEKRKDMYKYLTGGSNLNAAITAAAMEWASIGVPQDMKGHTRNVKKGESYYAGDGHNASNAKISPTEFGEGLKQQRNRFLALKKGGMSDQEAYTKSFDKDALKKANVKAPGGTGGDEAGFIQQAANKVSDTGKAVGGWLSNTSVGKTIGAVFEDPTAKKGVNGNAPLSDKNATIKKEPAKPAAKAAAKPAAAASAKESDASKSTTKKDEKAKGGAEWDLDKLCSYAVSNIATDGKTGWCARYVTNALRNAQIKKFFTGVLGNANQMPAQLVKMGWNPVGQNLTKCVKGDIAVFAKTGSPGGKKHGHICIWTGAVWVSDFIQSSVQPNKALGTFPYTVYRAKHGISNGSPVNGVAGDLSAKGDAASDISGGSSSSTEEPEKNAGEKLIDGMAKVMAFIAGSDAAKAAVNWLDSVEVDKSSPKTFERANLDGFDTKSYGQLNTGFEYKFGNGGGVSETKLFDPNMERQKGDTFDHLGNAGRIDGVVRQDAAKKDHLGDAGYIGNVRQNDINNKKKKKKWYNRLFESNDSWLGQLANAAGLNDIFGLGTDIVKANEDDQWGDFAWKLFGKAGQEGAEKNGLGTVFNMGKDAYDTNKGDGDWLKYGLRNTLPMLQGMIEKKSKSSKTTEIPASSTPNIVVDPTVDPTEFGIAKLTTNEDGTSTYVRPDGKKISINADGTILPENSTGIQIKDPLPTPSAVNTPVEENNIIPTVKEQPDGTRVYYNGDGSTVTKDADGKTIGTTPPTTNIPSRFPDLIPKENTGSIAPAPAAMSSSIEPSGDPLKDVLARQSATDNAFAKLRKDKVSNNLISDKGTNVSLTPNNVYENGTLYPDTSNKATIDEHVATINRQHVASKNTQSSSPVPDGANLSSVMPAKQQKNGGSSTASIITRNPDSIFREVSITMMKITTT